MDQSVKVKEEADAAPRWHLWCRLCAKEDPQGNINVCSRDENERNSNANVSMLALVGLYFSVNIADNEMLPKMLCVECHTLMTSLVTFHERVEKVQHMFCTLQLTKEVEDSDLDTIRLKYGVSDEQPLHNINEIDSKAVLVEMSDPLEQANVVIKTERDDDDVELTSTVNNDISYLVEFECESGSGYKDDRNFHSSPLNIPKRLPENPSSSESSGFKKIKRNYTCEECGRKFQYPSEWIRHIRIHNKEKRFAIDRCSKYLDEAPPTSAADATATAQEHKDEPNRFICKECPKGFKYLSYLKRHKLVHLKNKPFVCKQCDSRFSQRKNLFRHLKTTCNIPIPAREMDDILGFNLFSAAAEDFLVDEHQEIVTPTADYEMVWKVESQEEEEEPTTMAAAVAASTKQHEDVLPPAQPSRHFICDVCSKVFAYRSWLTRHMLFHTNQKSFRCKICNSRFSREDNLYQHCRTTHAVKD